jgi:imidazolonepropionase-like amidohydrolase
MFQIRLILCVLLMGWALTAISAEQLIVNVRIVDARQDKPSEPMDIWIQDGRIITVTPHGEQFNNDQTNAEIIDGRGQYLIPGLWDMHVHLQDLAFSNMDEFLRFGVTQVRDMGIIPAELEAIRKGIAEKRLAGPDVFSAGAMVNSDVWESLVSQIYDEQQVAHELKRRLIVGQKEVIDSVLRQAQTNGSDFLKIHFWNSSADLFVDLALRAEEAGFKVAAHHPGPNVSFEQLLGSGIDSLEHLDGILSRQLGPLSDDERLTMLARFAENRLSLVPSLIVNQSLIALSDMPSKTTRIDDLIQQVEPNFTDQKLFAFWGNVEQMLPPKFPDWSHFEQDLKIMKEALHVGVKILPGTDLGVPGVLPGAGLLDELSLMHDKLAMSPFDTLKSATLDSAQWLNVEEDYGTVEVGKKANLVLLSSNPIEEIEAYQNILWTMVSGKLLRP